MVMLYLAFNNISPQACVMVRFRYDGDIFVLRRLNSKTKTSITYMREAQYATILPYLPTMAQPCSVYHEPTATVKANDFYIEGHLFKRVDLFKYLGNLVTKDCKLGEEINAHPQPASCAFGRLRDREFDRTAETKLKVFNQCHPVDDVWM